MRCLVMIGRILFALIFIMAAPRHFSHEGIQHRTPPDLLAQGLMHAMMSVEYDSGSCARR